MEKKWYKSSCLGDIMLFLNYAHIDSLALLPPHMCRLHYSMALPFLSYTMHLYSEICVLRIPWDWSSVSWLSLIFEFSYMQMDTLGPQSSVQIMQVSLFWSVLINRFHCKLLETCPASKLKWQEACRHSSRAVVACTSIPCRKHQFSSDHQR